MALKAIETQYQGYRFRSRLEARWAILFDAMGIRWEYEAEGVCLTVGNYLPDFWLSNIGMWAEVKPVPFTKHEKSLVSELARESNCPALMLVGTPDYKPYTACMPDCGQEVDCYMYLHHGHLWASYGDDFWECPQLRRAITKARSARFEHGEKPW